MGIPHLNESKKRNISEAYFREKDLLLESKATDEVAEGVMRYFGYENLIKRATTNFEEVSKNFTKKLESKGITLAKIREKLIAEYPQRYKTLQPTVDEVMNAVKIYLKNNPELTKDILKEIPGVNKQVIENIKLDDVIPDVNVRNGIKTIMGIAPESLVTQESRNNINKLIKQLETDFPIPRPKEIDELIEGLTNQRKLAKDLNKSGENYVKNLSTPDNPIKIGDPNIKETPVPQAIKDEIKSTFNGNSGIKRKFQEFVRKVLYSTDDSNLKIWKKEDLNLSKDVEDFINIKYPDFFQRLESGEFKSLTDSDKNWSTLNMLDSNNADGKKYLEDLFDRHINDGKFKIEEGSKKDLENFIDYLNKLDDSQLKDEHLYLQDNKVKFTEKSNVTTIKGEETEKIVLKDVMNAKNKDGVDLFNKQNVIYHSGNVKGNPIDTILGIDLLIKNGDEIVPVQVKSSGNIYVKPSKVNPGKMSMEFWLTTPIRLTGDNVYGLAVDKKGQFVFFPPQQQWVKKDGVWKNLETTGFNRTNLNYVDINNDGVTDFITNIDY